MPWNLFDYAPCKCYHPALADFSPPGWFTAIVISVSSSRAVVFNLNYMYGAIDSVPGSGFPYTPYDDVRFEYDEANQRWLMIDGINRIFRFEKPDAEMLKVFSQNKNKIPSQEAMLERAICQFD